MLTFEPAAIIVVSSNGVSARTRLLALRRFGRGEGLRELLEARLGLGQMLLDGDEVLLGVAPLDVVVLVVRDLELQALARLLESGDETGQVLVLVEGIRGL